MESNELLASIIPVFIIRGGFAVLCGAIIGIERERLGKPAGFRTMTLICLGSALYMLVGEFMQQKTGMSSIDPTRIAAQVVTGIGFIGAGAIIQSRGTITGLTTAATIWVVAGIGLMIGAGFPWLGIFCCALVLYTLVILAKIEPKLLGKCHFVTSHVLFVHTGGHVRGEIAATFSDHDLDISQFDVVTVDHNTSRMKVKYCDKHPSHHRFLAQLWRISGIIEITTDKQ